MFFTGFTKIWWTCYLMVTLVYGRAPVDLCRIYFCSCPLEEPPNPSFAHCDRRSIRTIPEGSVLDARISELDLSNNRIVDITTDSFDYMPANNNLMKLNLGNNELEVIFDGAFVKLPNLKTLILKRNSIKLLTPITFRGLSKLEMLDLSFNDLKTVDSMTFVASPQLANLKLRGNPLKFGALANALSGLTSALRILDLHGLEISSLPSDEFQQVPELRRLILSDNEFLKVPTDALSSLGQLEHLELSNNPIQSLGSKDFRGINNIRELYLNGFSNLNSIEENTFANMPNLTVVHISYNKKLKSIHARAFGPGPDPVSHQIQSVEKWLPALEEVSMRQNALTVLDAHLLPWQHIPHVDLYENPWHCDCKLAWIVNVTWEHKRVPHISCKAPERVRLHRVTELTYTDFKCETLTENLHPRTILLVSLLVPLNVLVLIIVALWKTQCCARTRACHQLKYRRMLRQDQEPVSVASLNVVGL